MDKFSEMSHAERGAYLASKVALAKSYDSPVLTVPIPDLEILLAELEASKQYAKSRDAENESLALTVGRLRVELQNEGAANAHAYERIRELEKRLATPVRLPEACVYEVNGTRFYDRLSEAEVIASLREQGFTVEGDE